MRYIYRVILITIIFFSYAIETYADAYEDAEKAAIAGENEDFGKYFKYMKRLAEQGYPKAQLALAQTYTFDIKGTPIDFKEAEKWYRKAANQGSYEAQDILGYLPFVSKGIKVRDLPEKEREEAIKDIAAFQTKEAEQGNAAAQIVLAKLFHSGRGVKKSLKDYAKWNKKAAEQGNARAQYWRGVSYVYGKGVLENYEEAVKWYGKAAEQGFPRAQNALGKMYEKGQGVQKSRREAVKWYKKAAEKGYDSSQLYLAYAYAKGEGVLENYTEAYAWALVYDYSLDGLGKETLDEFRENFDTQTITAGQHRASELLELIRKNEILSLINKDIY